MRFICLAFAVCLGAVGCAPLDETGVAEAVSPKLNKTKVTVKAPPAKKTPTLKKTATAEKVPSSKVKPAQKQDLSALMGTWKVVRGDGTSRCALQLKSGQFGRNYAASSVCFGNPNIWAWNTRGAKLELFDNKGQRIASLQKTGPKSWSGSSRDTGVKIKLVR